MWTLLLLCFYFTVSESLVGCQRRAWGENRAKEILSIESQKSHKIIDLCIRWRKKTDQKSCRFMTPYRENDWLLLKEMAVAVEFLCFLQTKFNNAKYKMNFDKGRWKHLWSVSAFAFIVKKSYTQNYWLNFSRNLRMYKSWTRIFRCYIWLCLGQ